MQYEILAGSGWMLDLVFFLVLILGTAFGAYRGFVKEVCKLAGKIASLVIAFTFCVAFSNLLEKCFHMTTAITNAMAGSIARKGAYGVGLLSDVPGLQISKALSDMGIGAIPRALIAANYMKVELIPSGTTPAFLLSSIFAKWISIVISFLILLVLIRVVVHYVAKLLCKVKDSAAPLRVADQLLGAIFGYIKACFFIFLALLLLNLIPVVSLHDFIASSRIVGKIFTSSWFEQAASFAISGEWFRKLTS